MKIGFTGSRLINAHQIPLIERSLKRIVKETGMTYAITGGCTGVDAFIAQWIVDNTEINNIVIMPSVQTQFTDHNVYALERTQVLEMPLLKRTWKHENFSSRAYVERNKKIIELSDSVYAFLAHKQKSSGTRMTASFAKEAGKLAEVIKI